MTRICLPVRPEEDAIIRTMHAAGARDTAIAAELGRPRSVIHRARKRLGLAPLYTAGRPTKKETRS